MSINIVVKFQVEWIHRRKDCPLSDVSFLKDYHRHMFYITCTKKVLHDDRDVEIIMFKRELIRYLEARYFSEEKNCLFFDWMSCEMIAKELLDMYELESCEVLEDWENWALVTKN